MAMNWQEYAGAAAVGGAGPFARGKQVAGLDGEQALQVGVLAASLFLGDNPVVRQFRDALRGAADYAVGALVGRIVSDYKAKQQTTAYGPVVSLTPVSAWAPSTPSPVAALEI